MMPSINLAVVGLGYWGPNWLRNIAMTIGGRLAWGCDQSEDRLQQFSRQYPAVRFTKHYEDLLGDSELDGIVIATPTSSHFDLARRALLAGKHVLIEKPMTSTVAEAEELVALAKRKQRLILVDHTFAYTTAVQKIRSLVAERHLGGLLYFDSTRINLGIIQKDCNVLWDLAVHDLTILSELESLERVDSIAAIGSAHYGRHVEDAHMHLHFRSGFSAHIHCSWLSPVKIRQTIIAGRKSMIVYDDIEPSEKLRVYDRGIGHDTTKPDPFFPVYRSGDIVIPAIKLTEALLTEAEHFVACINGREKPIVSGKDGLAMLRILEAADESLRTGKQIVL